MLTLTVLSSRSRASAKARKNFFWGGGGVGRTIFTLFSLSGDFMLMNLLLRKMEE